MELNPLTNLPENDKPVDSTSLDTKSIMEALQPIPVETSAGFSGMENIDFSKWIGVNRKIGSDNEEARAQSQTTWDLIKGTAAQTAAIAVGGSLEGAGYLLDLFDVPKMAKLMRGEDAEFGNILSEFGKSIQDYTREELAPIYQTRAAQEGWALGDGTWWASHAPSLASTLSIMLPVFAARSAVMLGARTLSKSIKATEKGAKVLDTMADSRLLQRLNNRKFNNFAEQAGLSFTSRHIENSMESSSIYDEVLQRKLSEGLSEEDAKAIAGETAAQTYRVGYMNMWQDVIQWNTLLRGSYANRAIASGGRAGNKKVQDSVNKLREQYGDKGIIPAAALTKAGVNKKDLLLNAFGEGFEEFNQSFIQSWGDDYADYLSGKADKEVPKGFLESYFSSDLIDTAKERTTWDATFWGFLGGLVFGSAAKYGVFDKSVDFITRKNQMDNVNYMQREAAKFEYIQTLSNNVIKYQAEGNIGARDATIDKLSMAMTLGQIVDGNTGIATDSAIHEGRYQEMYDNIEKIANTPDNELDTQDKIDSKEVAKQLLPKMAKIKDTFEKNLKNTNYNPEYDLGIASALTEYQFLAEQYTNRISQYESQIEELKNDIELPDGNAKTIGNYKMQIKSAERTKEWLKGEVDAVANIGTDDNKLKATKEQLAQISQFEKQIEDIDQDIAFAKEQIDTIIKESTDSPQIELFANAYAESNEQVSEIEYAKKVIESLKQTYLEKYAKLQTKEGKEEYIKAIKKADKSRQEKVEESAIANVKTIEELDAIPIETTKGKKKVEEKRTDLTTEGIVQTRLGPEATPEAVQESVKQYKTLQELNKRKEEIENNISSVSIEQISQASSRAFVENWADIQDFSEEKKNIHLEYFDILQQEKELKVVSPEDIKAKEETKLNKAIDEGKAEPVVLDDKQLILEKKTELVDTTPSLIPDEKVSTASPIQKTSSFKSTQESNVNKDKGFKLNFIITDSGEVTLGESLVQRDNPKLRSEYAASPDVKVGDKVTLQLATDTKYNYGDDVNYPIYIVHEKYGAIAMIPSTAKELRKIIVPLLQDGQTINSTIVESGVTGGQAISSSNVNNVIDDAGIYYNVPLNDLEQVFNHRGNVGFPVTLAFAVGNEYSESAPTLELPNKVSESLFEYFKQDYIDNTKGEVTAEDAVDYASEQILQINEEIKRTKLTVTVNNKEVVPVADVEIMLTGLPYIVLPAPNGKWKALRLENSKLTATHIDFVVNSLTTDITPSTIQDINNIVYVNSDIENYSKKPIKASPELHKIKRKNHFIVKNIGKITNIEFFSPTLQQIIRTNNVLINDNQYVIITDVEFNEKDGKKNPTVSQLNGKEKLNLKKELSDFLATKYFNIQKDKLTVKTKDSIAENFISPVKGISYDSYFDYITSSKELEGNKFKPNNLAKSILSTTIKPVNNTPYHNIQLNYAPIEFSNKEIKQDLSVNMPMNTTPSKKSTMKIEATESIKKVVFSLNPVKDANNKINRLADMKKKAEKEAAERKKNCKGD